MQAACLAGLAAVGWTCYAAVDGAMFGGAFVMDNLARLLKFAGRADQRGGLRLCAP